MFHGRTPRADEIRLWQLYVGNVQRRQPITLPSQQTPSSRPSEARTGGHLDLHGLTAQVAYTAFQAFVGGSVGRYKSVTVVTGRSGLIRREFEHWIAAHPDIRRAEPLNGGGAFRVYLRKRDGR